MVAQILKRERTEEFHFKKPHSKKLEAASFTGCLSCAGFLAKMLIISIKQINAIPFYLQFKKKASKMNKCVIASY